MHTPSPRGARPCAPSLFSALAVGLALIAAQAPAQPSATLREIDLQLAGEAAGVGGLAARVVLPAVPRYGDAAPVAVLVPDGWDAGELSRVDAPLAAHGFVEVRFLFPGGSSPAAASGGQGDLRGPRAVAALADAVAFAAGRGRTLDGRTLAQIAAPLTLTPGVGLLADGNGGNTAILALARHRAAAVAVRWLALWQTPLGPAAALGVPPEATTGRVVYSRALPLAGATGGLFLDRDGDGRFGEGDLAPAPLAVPGPDGELRYAYPPEWLASVPAVPPHLLAAEEADTFWRERNAAGHVTQAAANVDDLLVMVLASDPAGAALYGEWLRHRVWVRLNPDAAYLAAAGAPELFETLANVLLSAGQMSTQLLPRELSAAQARLAAAMELADRARAGERAPDLEGSLAPQP